MKFYKDIQRKLFIATDANSSIIIYSPSDGTGSVSINKKMPFCVGSELGYKEIELEEFFEQCDSITEFIVMFGIRCQKHKGLASLLQDAHSSHYK